VLHGKWRTALDKLVHLEVKNREESDGWGMLHFWGRGEVYAGFWSASLRERDQLEDSDVDGNLILRWILSKWDVGRGID
jgi:hypothetical protein